MTPQLRSERKSERKSSVPDVKSEDGSSVHFRAEKRRRSTQSTSTPLVTVKSEVIVKQEPGADGIRGAGVNIKQEIVDDGSKHGGHGYISPQQSTRVKKTKPVNGTGNKANLGQHATVPIKDEQDIEDLVPSITVKSEGAAQGVMGQAQAADSSLCDINGKTVTHTRRVYSELTQAFGNCPMYTPRHTDLLDGLMSTMLSQNTTDKNAAAAFTELKRRFPTWDDVRSASRSALASSIKVAGLSDIRAQRMQSILEQVVAERGSTSLEYLYDLTDEQVKSHLSRFNGIGPKTIACLLMFYMQRPEFAVDTHIWRICKRIGWVHHTIGREDCYTEMNSIIDDEMKLQMHLLLIRHGKTVCHKQKPECNACPIRGGCAYGNGKRAKGLD